MISNHNSPTYVIIINNTLNNGISFSDGGALYIISNDEVVICNITGNNHKAINSGGFMTLTFINVFGNWQISQNNLTLDNLQSSYQIYL